MMASRTEARHPLAHGGDIDANQKSPMCHASTNTWIAQTTAADVVVPDTMFDSAQTHSARRFNVCSANRLLRNRRQF